MATLTDAKARSINLNLVLPHGGVTGLALHPSNTKGSGKWVLRYVSQLLKNVEMLDWEAIPG